MIAAVLSFIFAGSLAGVREGTVIAALLVGFIARLIGKKLAFLKDMIFPESISAENENEAKPGYTRSCKKRQLRDSRPLCGLRSQKFRKLSESIFFSAS